MQPLVFSTRDSCYFVQHVPLPGGGVGGGWGVVGHMQPLMCTGVLGEAHINLV